MWFLEEERNYKRRSFPFRNSYSQFSYNVLDNLLAGISLEALGKMKSPTFRKNVLLPSVETTLKMEALGSSKKL
jgi:hypothetical protein